jgi:hypothetical protein
MKTDDDQFDPPPAGDGPDPGPDRAWVTESPGCARVLRARATVHAAAAAELRREARALLARSADPLVVDLTAVRDVEPTTASGALRDVAYEAGDADVDLRVVLGPGAPEAARALLDDDTLFEVYPTLDAALRGRAGGGGASPRPHPGRPPTSGGG